MKKAMPIILSTLGVIILALVITFSIRGQQTKQETEQAAQTSTALASVTPSPKPTETLNSPTQTPTITPTHTQAFTATPTLETTFAFYDFLYNKSSHFAFDLNYTSGEYYGTGRLQDGTLLKYSCWFREDIATRLVCNGGAVPFDSKMNFQLYRKDTEEMIFNETFIYNYPLHGELLATPTGVNCEVEPQWNGQTAPHQLGKGCFAMSCWQNGAYLWGTDNTCREPWPFLWHFTHPLYTPFP